MGGREKIVGKHGGYRKLKSFQVSQVVYDVTVRFCKRYIGRDWRMCGWLRGVSCPMH